MEIEAVSQKLMEFPDRVLDRGTPITDNRVEAFEHAIGFTLTDEFKFLVKRHNPASVSGTGIFGFGQEFGGSAFEKMYTMVTATYQDFIPKTVVPFSPDGAGNYYCLDLSRRQGETCPVVFYQLNFLYENLEDIETCHPSFAAWVSDVMIGWNQELPDEKKGSIWNSIKSLFKKKG